jgi:hypothetical protein
MESDSTEPIQLVLFALPLVEVSFQDCILKSMEPIAII